jgi:predicted ABC-type sugar transport system permease subunit
VIGGGSLWGADPQSTDLLGITPNWQRVIIGAAIIIAVGIDTLQRRRTPA